MGGWMGGWMDGRESQVKDCLQQSKTYGTHEYLYNTESLKHYYQPSKKIFKEQEKEVPTPKIGPLPLLIENM
jgi:hypothetical protein